MDPIPIFPAMTLRAIGVVRSRFTAHSGTPIQPRFAGGAEGKIEVLPEYKDALEGLEDFDRVWVLSWLDRARPWKAKVVPYRDNTPHGLFATRAPSRPNPIGLSTLRLLSIDGATLYVAGLDLLDGTPVLDIKPYAPLFDSFPGAAAGWLDRSGIRDKNADGRFEDKKKDGDSSR